MKIKRTISGPRKYSFPTYGQELKLAKTTVESIMMKRKDMQCIKYIQYFAKAKLKIRGDNLSIAQIKKISDKAMAKLKIPKIPTEKIRNINMHILNLSAEGIKEVIEKLQFLEREEINKAA